MKMNFSEEAIARRCSLDRSRLIYWAVTITIVVTTFVAMIPALNNALFVYGGFWKALNSSGSAAVIVLLVGAFLTAGAVASAPIYIWYIGKVNNFNKWWLSELNKRMEDSEYSQKERMQEVELLQAIRLTNWGNRDAKA